MTILIATFTYGGDEEIAKYNVLAVQTLRKLYPQHKIIHYLIDDANKPFKQPFKDEGDTHYIQTDFARNGNLQGISALRGIAQTMDRLAQDTGADWVIKLDTDTVLLTLDFLNPEYDYIGSNANHEPKFYSRGWCATFKPQVVHEVALLVQDEANIDKIIQAKDGHGYKNIMGEDVLFGAAIVDVLKKKARIGDLNGNMQLSLFFKDNYPLNTNGACVLCKWLPENPESIARRMQKAIDYIDPDSPFPKETYIQPQKTVLVVTFTYRGDEEFTKCSAKSLETLRKLYPQYKIIHYIVDDKLNPFEKPMKDNGDTHYFFSNFDRQGNFSGYDSFCEVVQRLAKLGWSVGADWVLKVDPDTVLMSLDFLDENYGYIGSAPASPEVVGNGWNGSKFYAWSACSALKMSTVDKLWNFTRKSENVEDLVKACEKFGWKKTEDVLTGYAITRVLQERHLIGNISEDKNLFIYFRDTDELNPNASAATCKGRPHHGLQYLSTESVLGRMRKAVDVVKARWRGVQRKLNKRKRK